MYIFFSHFTWAFQLNQRYVEISATVTNDIVTNTVTINSVRGLFQRYPIGIQSQSGGIFSCGFWICERLISLCFLVKEKKKGGSYQLLWPMQRRPLGEESAKARLPWTGAFSPREGESACERLSNYLGDILTMLYDSYLFLFLS